MEAPKLQQQDNAHHHESAQGLNRVLSLSSLIFYGLAFMVPLTIFTTYGLVTSKTHAW